ncbi:hypothetical protein [Aestuariivirga sp.]|uniref:hypothetical protein n=1 Tax=Aestuariivirga sp. TaxID=2650926 RepID=UPI0039E548EA
MCETRKNTKVFNHKHYEEGPKKISKEGVHATRAEIETALRAQLAKAVEAVVASLIEDHGDKWQQVIAKPQMLEWFTAQAMKRTGGAFPPEAFRTLFRARLESAANG